MLSLALRKYVGTACEFAGCNSLKAAAQPHLRVECPDAVGISDVDDRWGCAGAFHWSRYHVHGTLLEPAGIMRVLVLVVCVGNTSLICG